MAGTPHGKINIRTATGINTQNANEMFVSLYQGLEFLKGLGVINRIALFYGDGASGMDFWDGANPPGNGAFAVYEFPVNGGRDWSWYFMIQYSFGSPFGGVGNGLPARIQASTGNTGANIGIAAAVGWAAGPTPASPWGGTTNNDGTDSKNDPVWVDPGAGLVTYPRSNEAGGTHAASKENTAPIVRIDSGSTAQPFRFHMMADDDCIGFLQDFQDNAAYENTVFIGPYDPITDLDPDTSLLMLWDDAPPIAYTSTSIGSTGGNTSLDGGAYIPSLGRGGSFYLDRNQNEANTNHQPNAQFTPNRYVESPIAVYGSEAGNRGLVGFIDEFLRQTYNVVTNSTLNTLARMVSGTATQAEDKLSFPWDGATVDPHDPASTRAGITF